MPACRCRPAASRSPSCSASSGSQQVHLPSQDVRCWQRGARLRARGKLVRLVVVAEAQVHETDGVQEQEANGMFATRDRLQRIESPDRGRERLLVFGLQPMHVIEIEKLNGVVVRPWAG